MNYIIQHYLEQKHCFSIKNLVELGYYAINNH